MFFQIARETKLLLININIYMKNYAVTCVFIFLPLYFKKIALLLANQN